MKSARAPAFLAGVGRRTCYGWKISSGHSRPHHVLPDEQVSHQRHSTHVGSRFQCVVQGLANHHPNDRPRNDVNWNGYHQGRLSTQPSPSEAQLGRQYGCKMKRITWIVQGCPTFDHHRAQPAPATPAGLPPAVSSPSRCVQRRRVSGHYRPHRRRCQPGR